MEVRKERELTCKSEGRTREDEQENGAEKLKLQNAWSDIHFAEYTHDWEERERDKGKWRRKEK